MGGMVKREFYFYQGGLIKVTVQYDKSVKAELIRDKIKETYGEDIYPWNASVRGYSPSLTKWDEKAYKKGRFLEGDEDCNRIKDCYLLAEYEQKSSYKITEKIKNQRYELHKQQDTDAKKKHMDALDL